MSEPAVGDANSPQRRIVSQIDTDRAQIDAALAQIEASGAALDLMRKLVVAGQMTPSQAGTRLEDLRSNRTTAAEALEGLEQWADHGDPDRAKALVNRILDDGRVPPTDRARIEAVGGASPATQAVFARKLLRDNNNDRGGRG